MSEQSPGADPKRYPVSVLLERRIARSGRWEEVQWSVVGAVVGEDVPSAPGRVLVHEEGDERRYLHTGLAVELFDDGCEGYWYNLMSGNPFLFVVCHRLEDESATETEIRPVLVTANQDEAHGYMEADDPVYSVPMPDRIHDWVERYVVQNYRPEIRRKRKRRDWAEEAESARRPGPADPDLH